jgi:lambda repressor-like predicted transcriptional regulator
VPLENIDVLKAFLMRFYSKVAKLKPGQHPSKIWPFRFDDRGFEQ